MTRAELAAYLTDTYSAPGEKLCLGLVQRGEFTVSDVC